MLATPQIALHDSKMSDWIRGVLSSLPLIGGYFCKNERPPPEVLPPAKIAIIGGGVGGCSAAYFLNREGGDNLDIHVFNDGDIGGRCAVVEFEGKTYEEGAAVIHSSNKYLLQLKDECGLQVVPQPSMPIGIYNGQTFVLQLGWYGFINSLKILWRYGLSVFKMSRTVSKQLKRFETIYQLQDEGRCYRTVPEMLNAMKGSFYEHTQVATRDYMIDEMGWNRAMVDELVCSAMRTIYLQNNKVSVMTAFVSLCGMEEDSLCSVIGGNYQIPKRALEVSGATVHDCKVTSVNRVENGDTISYSLEYTESEEGGDTVTDTGFDLVIVAHPLNLSTVQFNGFPSPIYTPAAKTPYHRTIHSLVKGELNGETFGLTSNDYPHSFPMTILTNNLENPPVEFSTITAEVPTTATEVEAKNTYLKPLADQPNRVWKISSNHVLSDEDKSKLFRKIDSICVKDWLAYPEYDPPEQFPPFVLDDEGLLYINCIEKAASAMEMSAIGAKNVALLAKEYILSNKKNN